MGAQFTLGVIPQKLKPLTKLSLVQLQGRWALWKKVAAGEYDNNGLLLTYEHFLKVFDFSRTGIEGNELFMYFESDTAGNSKPLPRCDGNA